MKIGQQPDLSPAAAQITQPGGAKKGVAGPAVGATEREPAGVGVTMSEQARRLEQTRAADGSDIDMDKVNAVRLAIENGSYVANAEAIADKLLANAREMLNRTQS